MPVLETPPNGELACCASVHASCAHIALLVFDLLDNPRLPDQKELQARQRAMRAPLPRTAIDQVGFAQRLHREAL